MSSSVRLTLRFWSETIHGRWQQMRDGSTRKFVQNLETQLQGYSICGRNVDPSGAAFWWQVFLVLLRWRRQTYLGTPASWNFFYCKLSPSADPLSVFGDKQLTLWDLLLVNLFETNGRSDEAKGQLHQAVKRKKESDSRAWKCLLVWGTADLILLIVLLIKYQLKYGLKNVAMFLVAIAVMLTVCYFGLKQYKPKVISEGPAYFEKVIPEGWRPEDLWKKLRPGPVNSAKMGMQAMRGSPV
eukprot:s617_g30.t1